MKRIVALTALCSGTALALVAQPLPPAPATSRAVPTRVITPTLQTPASATARIQFAELERDFGKVEHGAVVKHDFVFTNIGTSTLEITDVRPGCGCTTAGAWDRRVEPGKTGRIPLQLNTTGFSGTITKTATVTCNAAGQNYCYLQLKAQIWRSLEVTPTSAYFNLTSDLTTNQTRVVRIVNNLETPMTLSAPECTNQTFRTKLTEVRPGKEYELEVAVAPPFNWTYANGTVTLKTSATNQPLISIPVYARVQPVILASPSQITLPAGPLRTAARPTVTIRNTGTSPLALSEPHVNVEGAKVTLNEVQPGKVFTLAMEFPVGFQLKPAQRAEVTLKSNLPQFPTVTVPILQSVAAAAVPPVQTVPSAPEPPPYLARPRDASAVR